MCTYSLVPITLASDPKIKERYRDKKYSVVALFVDTFNATLPNRFHGLT